MKTKRKLIKPWNKLTPDEQQEIFLGLNYAGYYDLNVWPLKPRVIYESIRQAVEVNEKDQED